MARRPRRGKGSDETLDAGSKVSDELNAVSASDSLPNNDESYIPSAPRPPALPKAGRTDLNAAQGSQLGANLYQDTAPKPSRRQQAKMDAMRSSSPEPYSPVPGGMGGPSSNEPEYVSPTDEQMRGYARQSIDDMNAGKEAANYSWMNDVDRERFGNAVGFEMSRDEYNGQVQDAARNLSMADFNSLSVEGQTVTRDGLTYRGEGGYGADNGRPEIVASDFSGKDWFRAQAGDVQEAISHREAVQQAAEPSNGADRFAVFYGEGNKRTQFTESLPWRDEAVQDLIDVRGVLAANGDQAMAERLYVGVQSPYERAVEQVEQRDPQQGQKFERVYQEIIGQPLPSTSEEQKAPAVETEAKAMLKNTGMEIDEARNQAVYGKPTQIEDLRDAGPEARVTLDSGFSYGFDKETNQLVRYDADGNESGRKSFEEVQTAEHEHRARQYDAQTAEAHEQGKQEGVQQEAPSAEQAQWNEAELKQAETTAQQPEVHQEQAVEAAPQVAAEHQPENTEKHEFFQSVYGNDVPIIELREAIPEEPEVDIATPEDLAEADAYEPSEYVPFTNDEAAKLLIGDGLPSDAIDYLERDSDGYEMPHMTEYAIFAKRPDEPERLYSIDLEGEVLQTFERAEILAAVENVRNDAITIEQQPEVQQQQTAVIQKEQSPTVESDAKAESRASFEQLKAEFHEKHPEQAAPIEKEAHGEFTRKGHEQELSQQQAQSANEAQPKQESEARAAAMANFEQARSEYIAKEPTQREKKVQAKQEETAEVSQSAGPRREENEARAEARASFGQVKAEFNEKQSEQPEASVQKKEEEEERKPEIDL